MALSLQHLQNNHKKHPPIALTPTLPKSAEDLQNLPVDESLRPWAHPHDQLMTRTYCAKISLSLSRNIHSLNHVKQESLDKPSDDLDIKKRHQEHLKCSKKIFTISKKKIFTTVFHFLFKPFFKNKITMNYFWRALWR